MKKAVEEYILPKNFKLNWFPGHMAKTYRVLPEAMKKVDIFLEVRDSRIPISSGNCELDVLIPPNVKRFIFFNKFDLCDRNKTEKIVQKYLKESDNEQIRNAKYMFLSAKTGLNLKKIVDLVIRENNPKFKTVGTWCMVGGIPNVGKSTMINAFRTMSYDLKELETKKKATTGVHATTTRHIDFFKVNASPVIYIMDTPGIMQPKIYNPESGLKLSICGNIKEKIAGKEIICDYLLFHLNKENVLEYKKAFRLQNQVKDLSELLKHVMEQFKIQNSNHAFDFILKYFKDGRLGNITFDENIPKELIYMKKP